MQMRIETLAEHLWELFWKQLFEVNNFWKNVYHRSSNEFWILIWLTSCKNNVIIRSCVFPFRICHSYLSLYRQVFLYKRFYHYFEQVNVGWKVIKVILNLNTFSEFDVVAVKERKMSASTFLMNKAN